TACCATPLDPSGNALRLGPARFGAGEPALEDGAERRALLHRARQALEGARRAAFGKGAGSGGAVAEGAGAASRTGRKPVAVSGRVRVRSRAAPGLRTRTQGARRPGGYFDGESFAPRAAPRFCEPSASERRGPARGAAPPGPRR